MDEAIAVYRDATRSAPGDTTVAAGTVFYGLGTALRTQFERTARTDDLADAVAAIRTALDMQPTTADRGTLRPMYQAELSKTLQLWLVSTGEEAVIDEAVALARDAAEATPGGHVNVGFYRSRPRRGASTAGAVARRPDGKRRSRHWDGAQAR